MNILFLNTDISDNTDKCIRVNPCNQCSEMMTDTGTHVKMDIGSAMPIIICEICGICVT